MIRLRSRGEMGDAAASARRGGAEQARTAVLYRWAGVAWYAVLLVFGGASRADELAQVIVRTVSILVLALLWPTVRSISRPDLRPLMLLLVVAAGLIGIQLIPLPPAIWGALPGRAPYLELSTILNTPPPWRPINLTPAQGWNALLALLPCFATLIVIVALGRHRLSATVAAVAAAALLSAMLGVAQLGEGDNPFLHVYRVATASQPSGIFANRNHQALLLALALPVLAVWVARDIPARGKGGRQTRGLVAMGAALLLAMALLATGSRAGLLLMIPAGLAGIYFGRSLFAGGRKTGWLLLATLGAIGIAAIAAMLLADRSASVERLFAADAVTDKRSANFPALVEMAKTFFPIGSGFGSFDPVFRRFEPYETLTFTYFNEAHNDPLQVLIEGGLAGVLLMAGYLILWLRWSWRAFTQRSADPLPQLGSVVTLLCMLASVVDYPLRTPTLACVFVLATAWLAQARPRGKGVDDIRSVPRPQGSS